MQEQTERQRQIAMLLRQLASGLSSYRLFPGDIEQSAFVSAVARIQDAARQPLAGGTIALEVRGRAFATLEGPLPEDETTFRLAVACYERRVEQLSLRASPSAEELAAMYEALTRPVEEVAEAGGVEALLGQATVTSISLSEVAPQAIDSVVDTEALPPEEAETWEKLRDERTLTPDELVVDPSTAADVYGKFRDLVAALPAHAAEDPELYRRLQRAVTALPRHVRSDLVGVLMDESRSEPVAARMVSSITDHQLGQLLVELGEDGERDPVQLAEELVARRSRQEGLVELVRELSHGAASQVVSSQATPPVHEETGTVKAAVSDIVGEGPVQGEDAVAVTRGFPVTPEDLRAQALATLRDYLRAEKDAERLKRVLDLWSKEVQASLLDGGEGAAALIDVVESARSETGAERGSIFGRAKRRVLDVPFLQDLLGPDLHEGTDRIVDLLDPLGEAAVEGLLDVLGEETDRTRRSTLIAMIARLAGRYPAPVEARLQDDRWYVVRNAVNIMHKAEGGRERVARLERASTHAHAAVRREVIWGLVSILGSESASHMRGFVTDPDATVRERAVSFLGGLDSTEAIDVLADVARSSDDTSLRRRALDEISHSPSADAPRVLRNLTQVRSRPRLPWSLRRYARKLLKKSRS